MSTHHLTLIVDGADLQDESVVNGLFESGCDDALVGSADGVQFLDFDRDAATVWARPCFPPWPMPNGWMAFKSFGWPMRGWLPWRTLPPAPGALAKVCGCWSRCPWAWGIPASSHGSQGQVPAVALGRC